MATIAQIEQNFRQASQTGNMTLMTNTVNSITAAQKSQISASVYQTALTAIANHTRVSDSVSTSTVKNFMSKVGSFVPVTALDYAIAEFARDKNVTGLDAVTDFLTTTQKNTLNSYRLGEALTNVASITMDVNGDTTAANAVRDLMSKVGARISVPSIGSALQTFAFDKNLGGIDAITDHLSNSQKSSLDRYVLDTVVRNIAEVTLTDDAAAANAARDFMAKLGAYLLPQTIANALQTFAFDKNLAGIDAITDNILDMQKSSLDRYVLDTVVRNIAEVTLTDNIAAADAMRDFMSKLGGYLMPQTIESAVMAFVLDDNAAGVEAILSQITQLNALSPQALQTLAMHNYYVLTNGNDTFWHVNAGSNDRIFGLGGDDRLDGQDGNDIIYAGAGNDFVIAAAGNDFIDGGSGIDTLSFWGATTGAYVNIGYAGAQNTFAAGFDTFLNFENIEGTVYHDSLGGNDLNNYIWGGDGWDSIGGEGGNDVLYGEAGIDSIDGGNGNDWIDGGAGDDYLWGGLGIDTLSYATATSAVYVTLGNGPTTVNTLGAGVDYIVDFEDLVGTIYNDSLGGNDLNNAIWGGNGWDVLDGMRGNDTLIGGAGVDTLIGGLGADTLMYHRGDIGTGVDNVVGFNLAEGDKINIADLLVGYSPLQSDIDHFVMFNIGSSGQLTMFVDRDGTGSAHNYQEVANIFNPQQPLNAEQLLANGNLIV